MGSELGAPIRLLDDDEKQRLAGIRAEAERRLRELLTDGPDDPLGALAWLASLTVHLEGHDQLLAEQIDRAREGEGFTWRQIADALGEGDSPADGRRVMDRRRSWER